MRVVVAPNAFKGSLGAVEAAEAIARGVARVRPDAEIVRCPVADGGDGLIEVVAPILGARLQRTSVEGPLGDPVIATWAIADGAAIVETAEACGLRLVPDERRDPRRTTTFGAGQVVNAALDADATRLVVGIGGSATNDGGCGLAAALGVRFLDARGAAFVPRGGTLHEIKTIDMTGRVALDGVDVVAVCDVDNPLLGPRGAVAVFAEQKGATKATAPILEAGLAHLADVIERDLGLDVRHDAGAGAAGGLGAGLRAFLDAKLRPGVDVVLDLVGIDDALIGATLAITGEGHLDAQTSSGKAPAGVAARSRRHGVRCVALAGGCNAPPETLAAMGIERVMTLDGLGIDATEAMRNAAVHLETAAARLVDTLAP